MILSPKTTLTRPLSTIVVTLVTAFAATVAVPAPQAEAAAGVQGYLDVAQVTRSQYGYTWVRVAGWAYNGRTIPTQRIRVYFWTVGGGDFRDLLVDTSVLANQSRPDVKRALGIGTDKVGFDATFPMPGRPTVVEVSARDNGETGPWRMLSQSPRSI